MQVLISGDGDRKQHFVFLFGVGMIGSAIERALRKSSFSKSTPIPFSWIDPQSRSRSFDQLTQLLKQSANPDDRLTIVWSAGAANFYSIAENIADEITVFGAVMDFMAGLRTRFNDLKFAFHYLSSAGGLFEGQQVIGKSSTPSPCRPYGRLKLTQEQMLHDQFPTDEISIYRPSSVYGPSAPRGRQGLINVLVQNGRSGKETVLDSHLMALRDYVHAGDIGNFVARRIRHGTEFEADPVHFLVTSRSASIFEVIRKLERILHFRPRIRIDQNFGNHSHITFSNRVISGGWHPSSLDVGLRKFLIAPVPTRV
jgi:UDP-glucose 4-epimerase